MIEENKDIAGNLRHQVIHKAQTKVNQVVARFTTLLQRELAKAVDEAIELEIGEDSERMAELRNLHEELDERAEEVDELREQGRKKDRAFSQAKRDFILMVH